MKYFQNLRYLLAVITVLLLASCDELPCEHTNGVLLNAGFYVYNGVTLTDTSLQNLELELVNDDASVYRFEYNTSVQSISFPLSMLTDSSVVVLNYNNMQSDTITIHYTQSLHLESHQCGFDEFFEITDISATNHQLDSIWIRNEIVDYVQTEHIKIYF
jgi:hypothetical protein